MYCYICSTERNDVKNALLNMIAQGTTVLDLLKGVEKTAQIIQVGIRRYKNLKKADHGAVKKEVEKKRITHLINFRTMTVHHKECPHIGKNVLRAHLSTIGAAGLHMCGHCRPWNPRYMLAV